MGGGKRRTRSRDVTKELHFFRDLRATSVDTKEMSKALEQFSAVAKIRDESLIHSHKLFLGVVSPLETLPGQGCAKTHFDQDWVISTARALQRSCQDPD